MNHGGPATPRAAHTRECAAHLRRRAMSPQVPPLRPAAGQRDGAHPGPGAGRRRPHLQADARQRLWEVHGRFLSESGVRVSHSSVKRLQSAASCSAQLPHDVLASIACPCICCQRYSPVCCHGRCRTGARKVYKIIDFGLGRFDEYYAADEVSIPKTEVCSLNRPWSSVGSSCHACIANVSSWLCPRPALLQGATRCASLQSRHNVARQLGLRRTSL